MKQIADVLKDEMDGKEVEIRGWVHRERGSNKLKFVVLRDSSNHVQCVFNRENFDKSWDEIDHMQVETSIIIKGIVKKDTRAPTGYEVKVSGYEVVGKSENFPITKDQSIEFHPKLRIFYGMTKLIHRLKGYKLTSWPRN